MLLLCGLALPVGLISAFVAKALIWLIALITNLAFFQRVSLLPVAPQEHHLGYWVVIVPVIGALLIGLMARFGSEKIRGHGIPEALEAILLGRSLIKPKIAILKPLSSAISIGTGGPFGAEGPIIMTGGAFGSIFGQFFHLSAMERKTLLVAGAAAGMSAIFATPVAAILLAVELLLFEWKPRSFVPVAVASMVASAVRVPLLGMGPIFSVQPHAHLGPAILFAALLVGLVAGFGSCLLTQLVYFCEDQFQKLPVHWMWWPALGAVIIGLGGLIEPNVLGVGYDTIEDLMHGRMLGWALVTMLVIKAMVWAVALGSGTSGGVLAPLLIIGGGIGALVGQLFPAADPGLWALVGMTSMMAGTMRSPLTSMLFALELTHDLNALPALLIGCIAALSVTVLLLRRSILTEKLARRGQHIAREYCVDVFELMRAGDVMDPDPSVINARTTVAELSDRIANFDPSVCKRQGILIVDDEGRLTGIISRGDVVKALQADPAGAAPVSAVGSAELVLAFPEEPLQSVLAKMLKHDIGRLPVVDPQDKTRILGYLGRADILEARLRVQEEEEHREKGTLLKSKPALLRTKVS